MDSSSFVNCPNCNEKYTEVFLFPCMHSFCSKCTDLMKNGAETTCLLCSKSCYQDKVKRNTFVEKLMLINDKTEENVSSILLCKICNQIDNTIYADDYCVECDQFMCEKCSIGHAQSELSSKHQIVKKNDKDKYFNKPSEEFCEKHGEKFTIYCKICADIICPTCLINEHSDHAKSENLLDNLEEIYAKSSSDIKKKVNDIDDIIKNQRTLIQKDKRIESHLLLYYDEVRNQIEIFATELKENIDFSKKTMDSHISLIANKLSESVNNKAKKINDYIKSLTVKKSYYTDVINNKSNIKVFNLNRELDKNDWIEYNQTKEIETHRVYFKKPSIIAQLVSSEMIKCFHFYEPEERLKLKSDSFSACIFNEKIYVVNMKDYSVSLKVDIYEQQTFSYDIYFNFIANAKYSYKILNTQNNIFLYYKLSNRTGILKFQEYNRTFVEWKTFEDNCYISTTYQNTLLVTTNREFFELSVNEHEFNRIKIPDEAIISAFASIRNHQLKDKRYVVTSTNKSLFQVSLIDTEGTIIKTYSQESNNTCTTCTDGEKYIFVLEKYVGKITVLTTDLHYLYDFNCPDVKQIYYDDVNNKILLLKKREIIYFTYFLGKMLQ